jgi:fucose permease
MSSRIIGALIAHESSGFPSLSPPTAVAQIDSSDTRPRPTNVELDELRWGDKLNGPSGHKSGQLETTGGWISPHDLERSNPPTSRIDHAVEPATNASTPSMIKWRLGATCLMCFSQGTSDAAPGPLIPYMEKDYAIGYAIVSLIFIANAAGFISAAPLVQAIEQRFGRARAYIFAGTLIAIGYVAIICTPPFPVVVVSFLLLGYGLALNLAMNNAFCANLSSGTVVLGCIHGCYGLGGTVAPLMATAMITRGIQWSRFYVIPLSLILINVGLAGWSFRGYEKDASIQLGTASCHTIEAGELTEAQLLMRAIKNSTTLLGALFIFAYQGAEVSISG